MKNQLLGLIGLGLLLATASVYAQTGVMKANIPFNFIVDKTEFPAGNYVIQRVGISQTALVVESPDMKVIKVILPNSCESAQTQRTSRLVFHRYGAEYFLAQIWTVGNTQGRELPRSGREMEVATSKLPQDVVVAATLR